MSGETPRGAPPPGERPLPKRFYKEAGVADAGEGMYRVELDGRPVRTPGRNLLAVPSRPLAEALAGEWAAQGELINPLSMPLTRLTNSALDGVEAAREAVAAEIVRYAGSDLICYRAEGPARLVARQAEHWDPLLAWARDEFAAVFVLSEGIRFVDQPESSIEAIARALPTDSLRLAALNLMTTLSGSALIALAVWRGYLSPEAAWQAAHIDELTQEEAWGTDREAMLRREMRYQDFASASFYLRLLAN
ncbi:ATP12 family chaperone protein [Ancylobacter mangrovi]|uniref:ATP12 family chaperone protein n=1 Tax=Ancylobacter mangrovi TaxID=2972472 RepID=UPI002161A275|nr:ATP12 family protein [Ancylobacter mangrovi]MCS0504485.1 ATPase [Ancylobacter mangrovi]